MAKPFRFDPPPHPDTPTLALLPSERAEKVSSWLPLHRRKSPTAQLIHHSIHPLYYQARMTVGIQTCVAQPPGKERRHGYRAAIIHAWKCAYALPFPLVSFRFVSSHLVSSPAPTPKAYDDGRCITEETSPSRTPLQPHPSKPRTSHHERNPGLPQAANRTASGE